MLQAGYQQIFYFHPQGPQRSSKQAQENQWVLRRESKERPRGRAEKDIQKMYCLSYKAKFAN